MNGIKNKTSLKTFGYFFSIIFFILFLIFFYKQSTYYKFLFLSLSFSFFIITFFKSTWLKELNTLWFKLGLNLSKFISPVIIAIIFYCIITPYGYLKRMFKLGTKNKMMYLDKSFWRNCNNKKSNYNNPF